MRLLSYVFLECEAKDRLFLKDFLNLELFLYIRDIPGKRGLYDPKEGFFQANQKKFVVCFSIYIFAN